MNLGVLPLWAATMVVDFNDFEWWFEVERTRFGYDVDAAWMNRAMC